MLDDSLIVLPSLKSEDQFERIAAVLCPDNPYNQTEGAFVLPTVSGIALDTYHRFLREQLKLGIRLMRRGDIRDSQWEAQYLLASTTHIPLPEKDQKSDTPTQFELLSLESLYDACSGIVAQVKHLPDGQQLKIPLANLTMVNKEESMIIDDYVFWLENYRQ